MSFEFHKGKVFTFYILELCIWSQNVAEVKRPSAAAAILLIPFDLLAWFVQ